MSAGADEELPQATNKSRSTLKMCCYACGAIQTDLIALVCEKCEKPLWESGARECAPCNYPVRAPSKRGKTMGRIKSEGAPAADVIAELRAEIQQLKDTIMALGVLRDVQKIAIPSTPSAVGHATTGKRDWSKVSNEKLQELHGKYLAGSPKWTASAAELKARGL